MSFRVPSRSHFEGWECAHRASRCRDSVEIPVETELVQFLTSIPFQHSNTFVTSEVESWHAQGNVKLIDFGSAKDLANPQVKGAGIHNFKTVMQAEFTMSSPCVHYIYIWYIYILHNRLYIYMSIYIYICPSSMWPGLNQEMLKSWTPAGHGWHSVFHGSRGTWTCAFNSATQ